VEQVAVQQEQLEVRQILEQGERLLLVALAVPQEIASRDLLEVDIEAEIHAMNPAAAAAVASAAAVVEITAAVVEVLAAGIHALLQMAIPVAEAV
jgi:hypothetical protein